MKDAGNRLERVILSVSNWLNWVATAGILTMLLITLVDIVGAAFFRRPLKGAVDGASILGLIITAFAIPFTQIRRGHISVEFFVMLLPKRLQNAIDIFGAFLSLILFAMMAWQMLDYSRTIQLAGRTLSTIPIPLYPFTYATVLCLIFMCPLLIFQLISSIKEVSRQ